MHRKRWIAASCRMTQRNSESIPQEMGMWLYLLTWKTKTTCFWVHYHCFSVETQPTSSGFLQCHRAMISCQDLNSNPWSCKPRFPGSNFLVFFYRFPSPYVRFPPSVFLFDLIPPWSKKTCHASEVSHSVSLRQCKIWLAWHWSCENMRRKKNVWSGWNKMGRY